MSELPPSMTGGKVTNATPIVRYVNDAENSNKWWRAQIEAKAQATGQYIVVVRYGRVGTIGQSQLKTFSTQGLADYYMGKKLGEKIRKGYSQFPIEAYDAEDESYQHLDVLMSGPSPPKPRKTIAPKKKPEPAGRRIILD